MPNSTLTVISPAGTEKLIAKELSGFGASDIDNQAGTISCKASLETAYRCTLWSRFASRVLWKIKTITVQDEEDLYLQTQAIDWSEVMDCHTSFAINCTLKGTTKIHNNRFASQKMKDAIVDFFRDKYGERPSVKKERPELQLHLHIAEGKEGKKQTAEIFIDFSGESLHRRGYRIAPSLAPLKENLAASLVALSGWKYQEKEPLIDPMCGSGTLLIEAAMMEGDVAPGLSRPYFGFFGWKGHDQSLWLQLLDEAALREEKGLDNYNTTDPLFIGYDSNMTVIKAARKNIERAGLAQYIKVYRQDIALLQPQFLEQKSSGTIISNLPFGERLSEKEVVSKLYRAFGKIMKKHFQGWRCSVFIANPDLTDAFALRWTEKTLFFNGAIPCRLLTADINDGKDEEVFTLQLGEKPKKILQETTSEEKKEQEYATSLANRLRKNFQRLRKWSKKENIRCFRLYDSDLPEFNFALDIYEKWFHLQEYAPPKNISPDVAANRIRLAQRVIQEVFSIRSNRLFTKRRERQKGNKQYEKKHNSGKMYEVQEGDATLLVNFTDYLDTGLFLDHRPVRKMIFEMASGKRFLNLFAYTGSATIHAAAGGAVSTTTVDLSTTYLHWATMNMALNGFSEERHKMVKADSMTWLEENCDHQDFFDLIFIDPPTFSNTKKEKRTFDIQRDHSKLIRLAMTRLEHGGVMIFSTNFQRFTLDTSLEKEFTVTPLTNTIPLDFSRNIKIHKCWQFRLQS